MRISKYFVPGNILKNLARSALLSGLALMVGCTEQKEGDLALQDRVKQIEICEVNYSNSLKQAEKTMTEVTTKREFSENNQKQVYDNLISAVTNYYRRVELLEKCPESVLPLANPTNSLEWFPKLAKNVIGFDGGTPEIQKYFQLKYPGFKAASIYSKAEKKAVDEAFEAMENMLSLAE